MSRWPIFEVFPSRCLPPVEALSRYKPKPGCKVASAFELIHWRRPNGLPGWCAKCPASEGSGVKQARVSADGETITVHIPLTLRRRGGRKLVVRQRARSGRRGRGSTTPWSRAFRWRKMLDTRCTRRSRIWLGPRASREPGAAANAARAGYHRSDARGRELAEPQLKALLSFFTRSVVWVPAVGGRRPFSRPLFSRAERSCARGKSPREVLKFPHRDPACPDRATAEI